MVNVLDEISGMLFTACSSLILGEIIYYLSPKDKLIDCIYALLYTLIIIITVLGFGGVEWDLGEFVIDNSYQQEIDKKIGDYYALETEKELIELVEDALGVVHIPCKEISLEVENNGDSIDIKSIKVILVHKSDIDNAKVILRELFSDILPVEVTSEE